MTIKISEHNSGNVEKLMTKIDSVVKTFCTNKALYGYLYKAAEEEYGDYYWRQSDDEEEGKFCKSGADLLDAIKEDIKRYGAKLIVQDYYNTLAICGEYWIDEEHGFSISFPQGKFVKKDSPESKEILKANDNDRYTPYYTKIGHHSDFM